METVRGSHVKRDWVGGRLRFGFLSPVPCPFDYGHCEGFASGDGLGQDAVWLGPPAAALDRVEGRVVAVVRFVDDGIADDKWVVDPGGRLDPAAERRLSRFFRLYAAVKRLAGRDTRFLGVEPVAADPPAGAR